MIWGPWEAGWQQLWLSPNVTSAPVYLGDVFWGEIDPGPGISPGKSEAELFNFGTINILGYNYLLGCGGCRMCPVRCLAAPLASTSLCP